jgi:formamidopyrimidine-DNA glycosylase
MPELPDVEGYRRVLERGVGRVVERVTVIDDGVLRNTSAAGLGRALHGRRLSHPGRHGKWLLVRTDGPIVLMHFGMTGELLWSPDDGDRDPHDRVVLVTDRGELRYRDQRKLQGIWLAHDDDEIESITGHQGPDALGISRDALEAALAGKRGGLKSTLMDQAVIAGLGNLLTDEILWRARLHPARPAGELAADELGRLHRATGSVLRASVRVGRVPPRRSWLTGVRDRDRPVCPRCNTSLRQSRVGGRRSWWCPRCQPAQGTTHPSATGSGSSPARHRSEGRR